ncbi:MAG: M17 family peptidase N-terminal domain-containing protein [Chloroflexota bacterium]
MKITVAGGGITAQTADTAVIEVTEDGRLASEAAAVDAALGGVVAQMLADGLLTGRTGEVTVLPAGRRLKAKRVVVLGAGKREGVTADAVRTRLGNLSRRLRDMNAGTVALSLQESATALDPTDAGRAAAEAIVMGLYRFDRHHTREQDRPRHAVGDVTLVETSTRRANAMQRGVAEGVVLAEQTNFARDLANEPSNLMTPTIVAARAQQMAAELGIECVIIERAEAERLKMGSFLSVANGSAQPPKFIVLTYKGAGNGRPIALVGKGITFDTGGISLKPAEGMEAMKGDMSGAASVIAALTGLSVHTVRVIHSRFLREGEAWLTGRPGRGGHVRRLCQSSRHGERGQSGQRQHECDEGIAPAGGECGECAERKHHAARRQPAGGRARRRRQR